MHTEVIELVITKSTLVDGNLNRELDLAIFFETTNPKTSVLFLDSVLCSHEKKMIDLPHFMLS